MKEIPWTDIDPITMSNWTVIPEYTDEIMKPEVLSQHSDWKTNFEKITYALLQAGGKEAVMKFMKVNADFIAKDPKTVKLMLEKYTWWIHVFEVSTLENFLICKIDGIEIKELLDQNILWSIENKILYENKRKEKKISDIEAFRKQQEEDKRKQQWDSDDLKDQL